MENASRFEALIDKFAKIKERYGDEYPIVLFEPNIESKEKKAFKDLISRNNSIHLFSELENAFKFAQSLGISFILIVPSDYEEPKLIQEFQELRHTYERRMLDFEEEKFLRDLFKGVSGKIIKSLKAFVFCTLLDCLTESPIKEDEEEVMASCDIKDIAQQFQQEFIVIWYDPDLSFESKAKLEEEIDIKIEEKNTYTEFADLHERIKTETTPYHLIMSDNEKAENILKEIDNKSKDLLGLYIYDKDFKKEKQIDDEKVEIRSSLEELVPRIKEGLRTRSKLKYGFPAFATNFDISDRTGINKLHYYLKGLRNFSNRKQAKEDFIKLARKIYQDEKKQLVIFQNQYNEYNKAEILRWYTKESPIYKLINNCLRISSSDSILYCRLLLKDLERAIREQYREKSKNFNGLVFRGAYISTEEWQKLERNIGQEIEMYGFLSTTVSPKTAVNFLKADLENKILIKIIVPPLPEEDEQGFADISKFSEFQNEQEILFNVRSRFRILEAGVSKIDNRGTKCRQLVLLYGVQSLRKYMMKTKSSIEINLEFPHEIKCDLCGSNDKLFGFKQPEGASVNCLECLIKDSMPRDTLLIAVNGEKDKRFAKIQQGTILKFKEGVAFANSGYICYDCKDNAKGRYYKWMSCDGNNILIECSECLESRKTIKNRILISEGSPYAMWQESQEEWETISSDYHLDLLQEIELGNPTHVYLPTEDNRECLNYAKRMFEKNIKRRRRESFKGNIFPMLAEAFLRLGEYQQALTCWKNCQGLMKLVGQDKFPDAIIIYTRLGLVYHKLAKHKEALECYHQALEIGEYVFKEIHPLIAVVYHGIAEIYASVSEHKKALDSFKKSLDLKKSAYGVSHPTTADGYSSLGLLYRDLGRYQEALKYLTLALEIHESIYGEKHSSTAYSYANLAAVHIDLGDHQKAIKLFNKAIDIQKSIHQGEHPFIAILYNHLAKTHLMLGQYQEAMKYSNKALDIDTAFYGEGHSKTAHSLNSIGLIWQSLGDYQKALEYLLKSVDYLKSFLGEKHSDVAASYINIGTVYQSLGEYKKALEYLQKGLNLQNTIFESSHEYKATLDNNVPVGHENLSQHQERSLDMNMSFQGEKHPHISVSYTNIGMVYSNLGQHSKAIEYYNKALEIGKLVFGELNPGNASSYNDLAISYESLGDFQHALEYYTKALEIQKSSHQGDHPTTATFYNNLGSVYIKLGEFGKAKDYLKKALRMRKAILQENHPDFGFGYNNLGLLYGRLKKSQRAQKYFLKAIAIFEVVYGETHRVTADSYDNIGLIYSALGNRQEAIEYKKKSLRIRQIIYGESNAIVATSYNNLGSCYLTFGDYQKARDNFLKSIEIAESLGEEKHLDAHKFYQNLFGVYSKLGDRKKAYECFVKAFGAKKAL